MGWIGGITAGLASTPWLLGFGTIGIAKGSFAAAWMGPAVAKGSLFATCQSLAMTGTSNAVAISGATMATAAAMTPENPQKNKENYKCTQTQVQE